MGKKRQRILIVIAGLSHVLALFALFTANAHLLIWVSFVFVTLFLFALVKPIARIHRDLRIALDWQEKNIEKINQQHAVIRTSVQGTRPTSIRTAVSEADGSHEVLVKSLFDSIGITDSILNIIGLIKNQSGVVLLLKGTAGENLLRYQLLDPDRCEIVSVTEGMSTGPEVASDAKLIAVDVRAIDNQSFEIFNKWYNLFFRWLPANTRIYIFDSDSLDPVSLETIGALWETGKFIVEPDNDFLILRVIKSL